MKKAVIALAVVAVGIIIWLSQRSPQTVVEAPAAPNVEAESPAPNTPQPAATPQSIAKPGQKATTKTQAAPAPANWPEQLDQILRAEKPESEKAAQLLAALPNLAEADQIETARHLVNLLADEDFDKVKPYLLNTTMPEEVISILFHDSMLRPESVKEPLFLAVMQTPDHPFAETAKTALELFVGEDYKTDWPQWETALRARLKELEKQ